MAITEFDVIRVLDKMRSEKHISIINFTSGIMSRRTYSRLLSGESKVGFAELIKLVERLGVPLLEFLSLTHNTVFMENIHEFEFQQLIYDHKFEEAYRRYYKQVTVAPLRTPFSAGFPLAIPILEEKMGIISRSDLEKILQEKVDLNYLLSSYLLTDDSIEVLTYFAPYANGHQKEKIADYLYKILIEAKGIIIGTGLEQATLKAYYILLRCIPKIETNKKQIMESVIAAARFTSKAVVVPYDIDVMHAIKLINDSFYFSDYVVVHLIAALRTSVSPRFDSLKESIFNEKNVDLFISQINDDFNAGIREPLLQEIIKDAEKVLRST